jgi:hypothetical protein
MYFCLSIYPQHLTFLILNICCKFCLFVNKTIININVYLSTYLCICGYVCISL